MRKLTANQLAQVTNVNAVLELPLLQFRRADGTVLAAAAGAGYPGFTSSAGTALRLISEAAQNTTKTSTAIIEMVVPSWYQAGVDPNLIVNVSRTVSAGTTLSGTIDVEVYKQASNGTGTTDLCGTAAQNHATAATDYTFALEGASLTAGDKLLVKLVWTAIEAGDTGTVVVNVNSVRFDPMYVE